MAPGVAKTYRSDRIEVDWEPRMCTHVGACFMGFPEVFDPRARPWVRLGDADPDRVAEIVMRCPTGALHFRRLDDGPQEDDVIGDVEVRSLRNGPTQIRGRVKIRDAKGEVIREDTRVSLCRCGASEHKPFCDGSHRRVAFRDPGT
jgi:uncharacterized Fe-S cluster protein YjdI